MNDDAIMNSMRCPNCGAENVKSSGPCRRCGVILDSTAVPGRFASPTASQAPSETAKRLALLSKLEAEEVTHEKIAKRMRIDYMEEPRTDNQKVLEYLQSLLGQIKGKDFSIDSVLEDVAENIQEHFHLRTVSIGLRNPEDGKYRYDAIVGCKEDAVEALRRLAYVESDFTDNSKYEGYAISDLTRIYLEEDRPFAEDELDTYQRPALMKAKRLSLDDNLEGDYIDVHIRGPEHELLGWIELSGTFSGKLPDIETIRWCEVFASVIGLAIAWKGSANHDQPE